MYTFKPHVFTEHSPNGDAEPEGRFQSTIRCNGKNLYIYGGMDSNDLENYAFRKIWVYNLARQQWRLMRTESNLPDNSDFSFGTILESNYLVIYTIRYAFDDEPLTSRDKCRLHICDLNTESVLVQGTSGQISYPSYALNLIRHGKYIYTVGIEKDYGHFSDVHKLNLENLVWEVVYICRGLDANEPVGRINHTLVYGNNMIYIFGGFSSRPGLDTFSFVKISAFDLENCCWKKVDTYGDEDYIPHYPVATCDFAVTSYTDPDSGEMNVIISGGLVRGHKDALNDVWRLNLTSLKWTCLERFGTVLPCPVNGHSMTISPDGKLFTFGGYIFNNDTEEGICSSTLHSTWLRIPRLEDICWEAVFHYYPNLISMTDKEIIALGIPPQLLKSHIN
ncbi:kelch domain-containing protein 10 homolog [Microplitis mediator]|uniref:kelch domain-containing protein 10 homolog n=1 Tax=Microplitis mediator TaxID=375433 RepID=UPI002557AECF|nr:kelch domain-containing protein 10 homolog [Microplitis mediator]